MSYFRKCSLQKVRHFPDELLVFIFQDRTEQKVLARLRVLNPDNKDYPKYILDTYSLVANSPNFLGRELFYAYSFLQERNWFLKMDKYNEIVTAII